MGFGKRVCEILAAIVTLALVGVLVWYFASGMGDRGYEKEGTLVWEANESSQWNESWDGESAYPAFVTDPASRIYGEQELSRSGKGL